MRSLVWALILLLFILHQDNWNWDSANLVFGFLPIGLLYHIGISVAAAVVWMLACQYAWPESLPDGRDANEEAGS